jgi:TatD DNase family protein
MWIDSHAHLYDLDGQSLTSALHACESEKISLIVNTGTSLSSSRTVLAQISRHKELFAVVGISPFDAGSLPDDWNSQLEGMLENERIIALGETGLDSTNPRYPDIQSQLPLFEGQLELAQRHDLPVILHSRGSESRVADMCAGRGIKKAMFHCFTGDIPALKRILDAGYYVSFSGIITFPNTPVSACVEYAPIDMILIETDSPYLAPVPFRGKKNQPAWASYVGKKVAEIKKMDEKETANALAENFKRLFKVGIVGISNEGD